MKKQAVVLEKLEGREASAAPPRRAWVRLGLQLLALFLVATSLAAISGDFEKRVQSLSPEMRTDASTFNERQSGYKGFFELCSKTGLTTDRWRLPYRDLSNYKGTLVILAPMEPPADFELDQIMKWVSAGNQLVYIDSFRFGSGQRLLHRLHLGAKEGNPVRDEVISVDNSLPEMTHVGNVVITASARLTGEAAGRKVYARDKGGAFFCEVTREKGRYLLGTSPAFAANARFGEVGTWGNFQFLINWLREASGSDPVLFDEKAHGFSSAANLWIVLARSPVGLMAFQLSVILAVALVSQAQRFNARRPLPVVRKISNLEFIEGLSNTYLRARAYAMVYGIIYQQLKHRLCKSLSVSPHEDAELLAVPWAEAIGGSVAECKRFIEESQKQIEAEEMTQERFIEFVSQCDRLAARSESVLGAGGRR